MCGHEVEIFTTCAVDHRTWRNELPAGVERHGLLRVHRFPVIERELGVHGELDRALTAGFALSADEELLWLRHGVSSEAMEEALSSRADRVDAVIALPYLHGTTYFAYRACPARTLLIPCLHDEPFAYRLFVREMLSGARGLLFNTGAEARLAERICGDLAPSAVVGLGLDPPAEPARLARRFRRRSDPPSLLYVGRREAGKNTPLLTDYFMRYKHRRPGPLRLLLAGSGDPVPAHPDISEFRPDWSRPYEVFRRGTVFCLPSTNESLSIVLLRAWLSRRPALVHGRCEVAREHCERSNGGLWFTSYAEFEEVLDRLLASPELRAALGANGEAYVLREYSWPAVLDRFHAAMRRFVDVSVSADLTGTR